MRGVADYHNRLQKKADVSIQLTSVRVFCKAARGFNVRPLRRQEPNMHLHNLESPSGRGHHEIIVLC